MNSFIKAVSLLVGLGISGLGFSNSLQALTIHALPTDLPDTVPGIDRWQVAYTLDLGGSTFSSNQGFTIYFSSGLYSNLNTTSSPSGWDVLTLQPETILIALDGLLDALALVDNPSVSTPFVVEFDWLASGSPKSQLFELYSLQTGFQLTGTGSTHVQSVGVADGGGSALRLFCVALLPAIGFRIMRRNVG